MRAGFYKKENDEMLLYGANKVVNNNYSLYKEDKDEYQYPFDGWYWFDDEDSAYNFFGVEVPNYDDIDEPYRSEIMERVKI